MSIVRAFSIAERPDKYTVQFEIILGHDQTTWLMKVIVVILGGGMNVNFRGKRTTRKTIKGEVL